MEEFRKLGWLLATIAVLAAGMAWSGYALAILWGWFISPVFGLPLISVNAAIGVSLVASYLTKSVRNKKDERPLVEQFTSAVSLSVIRPLVALGVGWCVRLFA